MSGDVTHTMLLQAVTDLYNTRDLFFEGHSVTQAVEKPKIVESQMNDVITLLETNQKLLKSKAELCMLKGKCLNVASKYDSTAEELLSKAVKLDPKLVDAWNNLGEVYWKKGDINSAKNCFTGALQHSKNKVSLRNLSMVLRQFGASREEKLQFINDSVQKAKEAIEMDIQDGTSWFILGNAYLAQFFGGTQNKSVITLCMKAYSQAEKDPAARNNPDLHFNRSMCHIYQGEFAKSLLGFQTAYQFDPSWEEPQSKATMIENYLKNLDSMIKTKCNMAGKNKLQKIMSTMNEADLGPYGGGSYKSPLGNTINLETRPIARLSEGGNSGCVVCGKVLASIAVDPSMPYTFILIDADQTCIPICTYNVSSSYGVTQGDAVAIPEPYVMNLKVNPNGDDSSQLKFKFIRIETPMVLVVNGKKLGIDKQAPTMLKVTAQSE